MEARFAVMRNKMLLVKTQEGGGAKKAPKFRFGAVEARFAVMRHTMLLVNTQHRATKGPHIFASARWKPASR